MSNTTGRQLLQRRKLEKQKRRRITERAAAAARLSPRAQAVRAERAATAQTKQKVARAALLAQKRTATEAAREQRLRQLHASERAEASKRAAAAAVLAAASGADPLPPRCALAGSAPARPRSRATRHVPAPPAPISHTPTIAQLCTDRAYTVSPAPLPPRAEIEWRATTHVFASDVEAGVCVWDEGAGGYARPSGWRALLGVLYAAFDAFQAKNPDAVTTITGEYNAVFKPDAEDALLPEGLLALLGASAETLVVRVTRPDLAERGNGVRHVRFKPLAPMVRELSHTLHAAANDIAPRVRAALLFPASVRHGKQLYGALYVCERAERDAHTLADEYVATGRLEAELCDGGAQLARRVLQLLHHQSALGALSADVKPSNIVFDGRGRARAIDFDGAMYSLMHEGDGWAAHLLANLALATAHVRAFQNAWVAHGWAEALRSLVLELVVATRLLGGGAQWLLAARAAPRGFVELEGDSCVEATQRFEFVVHAYFADAKKMRVPFQTRREARAPPLIEQLVCFGLYGHTQGDAALDRAMGRTF
jgi:hypothetical protein